MKKMFLLLILPLLCWAQLKFIPISVDYSSFSANDSSAYVEIYLSVFQGNLRYAPAANGQLTASFTTKLELLQNGAAIREQSHSYQNSTQDTSAFSHYNRFVDIYKYEIPFGIYQAKVQLVDNNTQQKVEYLLDVIAASPQANLYFSDVELCTELKKDTTRSMFHKNQLKVVPNPSSVYDVLQPMLYFYVELNKLPFSGAEKRFYEFEYFITSVQGDTVKKKAAQKKEIFADTQVEAGGLNVMSLPQNDYFLNVKASDLLSGNSATARRKFRVYKPSRKDSVASETRLPEVANVYMTFTKEQLVLEFNMSKYIASRPEEKVFKNLENEEAMRKFLTQFWNTRDQQAHLSFGVSRQRYMRLVEFANENFTSLGRKGWQTDRGRVILLYGEPDEYERYPSSMDRLPYQIWRYHNLEGGAFFVFADLNGFGEYQLIHSSYRSELQNPEWQNIVNKQTGSGQWQN